MHPIPVLMVMQNYFKLIMKQQMWKKYILDSNNNLINELRQFSDIVDELLKHCKC